MSLSWHVNGVRDLDGEFAKWMAVKAACDEAPCEYPQQLIDYVNRVSGSHPSESVEYLTDEARTVDIVDEPFVAEWEDDYRRGYSVDVHALPKEIKAIRFYVSS